MIASKIFLPGEPYYIKVGLSDRQPLETMDACFIFCLFLFPVCPGFLLTSVLFTCFYICRTYLYFVFLLSFLELYIKREDGLRLLLSLIPSKGCRFPCSHQSDWVRVVFSIHLFLRGKRKMGHRVVGSSLPVVLFSRLSLCTLPFTLLLFTIILFFTVWVIFCIFFLFRQ